MQAKPIRPRDRVGACCLGVGNHGSGVDGLPAVRLTLLVATSVERSPPGAGQTSSSSTPGRRPDGQPGHDRRTRVLVPNERVAMVVLVKPERCFPCQHPLSGDDAYPQLPEVAEIPPITTVVTKWQSYRLVCPPCGEIIRAEVPPGIPPANSAHGSRRSSPCAPGCITCRSVPPTVMDDFFGISLGLGTIAHPEHATAHALAALVAEAWADVQAQALAYADATVWREGPHPAWQWTVIAARVTYSRSGYRAVASGPGVVGRAVLWVVGDRSVARLYPVSHVATAAALVPSAAGQ
jgi:hypothetical protein